jgi:RimJ/RimL family protein N-acetyltransferase
VQRWSAHFPDRRLRRRSPGCRNVAHAAVRLAFLLLRRIDLKPDAKRSGLSSAGVVRADADGMAVGQTGGMRDDTVSAPASATDDTPALGTARLRLEPLRVDHAEELAPVLDDPRLHEFTGGRPLGLDELRDRYARQVVGRSADGRERWLNWVVREHASGLAVGQVQATVTPGPPEQAEMAWTIAVGFQGRGYVREAAAAVAGWLNQQGIDDVIAHIHPDHVASSGVAGSFGLSPTEKKVAGEVRWSSTPVPRARARDLRLRVGGPMDEPTLLRLFDEAIAWLVARDQTDQWGSAPYSSRPAGVEQVHRLAGGGGLRIAELGGQPVGALVTGPAPTYVPPADRNELYIQLLLTSRAYAGQQIGVQLVTRRSPKPASAAASSCASTAGQAPQG